MAAVHEQLYAGQGSGWISLEDYVFELAQEIRNMQQTDIGITVQPQEKPIHVDLDTAVPLGLMLNEIISNACEHAFPTAPLHNQSGTERRISIDCLHRQKLLTVRVSDNGMGFTQSEFDELLHRQKSLGLILIDSLAQQLRGRVYVDDSYTSGARFVIEIPADG